ncbi:MAG: aminoglycoside phosphotransferase family protein [Anaerolineales bacterium]
MTTTVPADAADPRLPGLLAWAETLVGPCAVAAGDTRLDGRSAVLKLSAAAGAVYLKVHTTRESWENEVHATGAWAPAFAGRAPRLLGAADAPALALLLSEVPGTRMEDTALTPAQEVAAWRAAGQALAALHAQGVGPHFGACLRDGRSASEPPITDAVSFVLADLEAWTGGERAALYSPEERRVIAAARERAGEFAGEPAIPCHRDYNPYNWLVDAQGAWAGVIDFEFAWWDVRVAEFSRYPDWENQERPALVEALFEGYGRPLTARERRQLWVSEVQYAAAAVAWGCEHSFFGFAAEGRTALARLSAGV